MKKIISIFSLVFFGLYFSAMAEFVQPGDTTKMCTVDVLGVTSASESAPVTKIKALWCPEPTTPEHATTCVLDTSVPGTCSYTTNCELGYQPTGADRVDGQNGYKSTPSADNPSTAVCPSCEAKQITCSAGKYLPANSETCDTCTKGYACPGGTFTYTGAEQGRSICSAGKYSAAGASSCSSCQAGTYSASPGAESCSPCAAGAYSASTGAKSCTLCPGGTFAELQGATKCTLCSAGTTSADGASSCSDCDNKNTGVDAWVAPTLSSSTWTTKPTVNNICTISMCKTGNGYVATNQDEHEHGLITGIQTGKIIDADTGVIKSNTSYAVSDAMQLSAGTYVFKQTNSNTGASMPLTIYKFASSSATTGTSAILKKAINKDVLEYHFKLTETSWVRISWRAASASNSHFLTKDYTNECNPCTAGNYCRGGTNPSHICPIGSYSGDNASTCTECDNNKTTDHEGSTTINDCQLCSNSTGASTWADNDFDETTGTMSNVCSVTSCEATYAYGAGTCTACTAGNYCPGGTESAHICPVGSYSGDLQSVCTLCTEGTTTTNTGSTSSSLCDTCPNATGVSTSGWQTPTFNNDNSFVNNKCSVSSCNAGYAYISTAHTAGYIEIAPSDMTTYPVELIGWKAFTLNGSETWSTQAHFTGTYDVAMSETATDSPVPIYNENYTTAATATGGKVIQGGGYIGFGTTIEYSRSDWTSYLNAHPHTVLAQLATSDASKWRAVKRASDGMFGYYCTSGAQLGTFVGAKGMTGTETSTRHWLDSESAYQNACSMCPAGQSCTGGTTQGTECADGKYAQAGASSCTDCVMGAYTSSTTGHAKCTACTDGTTTNGAGGASCNVRCSNYNDFATWATPTWTVTISTNSVTNQCKISECKAGSWFKDNTSNTSTTVFTNTCNPCPIGSYKTDTSTANSQCTLCAEGTTTTTIGATTSTACTACPNATGVKTDGSGWITPKFATGDNGLVLDKCSVSNCSAGQSYTQSSLAGITEFAEYTQLEYIELNGKQFIDTGLKANEKSVADIVFSASSAKGYNCMFGARASAASKAFDVFWPSSSISRATVNFANIGGTTMSDIPDLSLNTPTRFVLDDSGLTIENLLKPLKPHGDGFTTDGNVYVGDINGANCNTGESGNHKSYGKIYSFKFYQNASTTADNTLSRDMVPCKKTESNGTVQIGMCDLVSKQFFGNAYTGSDATDFIPGPEITTTTDTSKSGYTRSCPICPAGSFCTGNQDTGNECVAGSYSTEGESVCTACDKGKYNTGTGNTTCSTNCATVEHLATNGWEQPVWATNNTMSTDVCLVARCVNGYHVCVASDNASSTVCTVQKSCNANNIILDWDENFGTAITNGSCDYDGSVSLPSAPTRSNWQFNGWVFTGSSNN